VKPFIRVKNVGKLLGIVGAFFAAVRFAEWVINLRKPSLDTLINKPYTGLATYEALLYILNDASGDISMWGRRCIYLEGHTRCWIENVWQRIDRLARENIQFNLEECQIGRDLVERINQLDNDADKKLSSKWFWTRWFNMFLDANPFDAKRDVGLYYNNAYSKLYTRQDYIDRFGQAPNRLADRIMSYSSQKELWEAGRRTTEGKQNEQV